MTLSSPPCSLDDILTGLAFAAAGRAAAQVAPDKGCRLAILPAESWQADSLRLSPDVTIVETIDGLRAALNTFHGRVIFLPHTAMVTYQAVENICAESSFDKLVIFEDDKKS